MPSSAKRFRSLRIPPSRCDLARGALPRRDIAPLHFAYDPMQKAGADHFVLAKLRRNVLKCLSENILNPVSCS